MLALKPENAEKFEAAAAACEARNDEILSDPNWEMSDSGVSLHCNSLTAEKNRLLAELAKNNGKASFPALFDLAGKRMPAKLFKGKFGMCWGFLDKNWNFTGVFVGAHPARPSTLAKKGYKEGEEEAPATVRMTEGGSGMAGIYSCRPYVARADKGCPAEVVEG